MVFAAAAVERAMKIQQVLMRALSGAITWLQAADILGLDPRSVRRWRARFEAGGAVALYDRRCQRPSRRKAPAPEVQRILRLYRERFLGWNVRHFYRFARRDHAVRLSYSFVKLALQEAGLVRKGRARGRHRRRREPRPCFGELLHLDGSRHAWLRLAPQTQQTLIAVIDDAHGGTTWAVAFAPDGSRVASAGHDGVVRFWRTETGAPDGVPIIVRVVEPLGAHTLVTSDVDGHLFRAVLDSATTVRTGDRLTLRPKPDRIRWFDPETTAAL